MNYKSNKKKALFVASFMPNDIKTPIIKIIEMYYDAMLYDEYLKSKNKEVEVKRWKRLNPLKRK